MEREAKQVLVGAKGLQAQRDLKALLVQQVAVEARVMQVLVEVRVPQDQEELQGLWAVTGNNVFLRI